jgi:hypothetical protein
MTETGGILIDPLAVPDDVRALFALREVVTVLTSAWHERDAATLGFPVWRQDEGTSGSARECPHVTAVYS